MGSQSTVTRVQRTKEDLRKELSAQITLLQLACESFDRGAIAAGKHISLSLRLLIHHEGRQKSLLEQLGLRNVRFFDSAGKINPGNLLTSCNLTAMRLGSDGATFIPHCSAGSGISPMQKVPFAVWWNEPVVKDNKGRTFNRRELILNVAETDGGAHVDPALDETYMDLSRNNSLGWMLTVGEITTAMPGPELACMRQIAQEVICTLQEQAPWAFSSQRRAQ